MTPKPDEILCHCGKPLHYSDPAVRAMVEDFVNLFGPDILVTVEGRSWLVPRHYIALHGVNGWEVGKLGFPEVKSRCD
jgi:hypothetical protein